MTQQGRLAGSKPQAQRSTRRALAAAVAIALGSGAVAATPSQVHASLFGEENASLLAILAQEIEAVVKAAEQVAQLIAAVKQLTTLTEQGATLLSKATGGSAEDLLGELTSVASLSRAIDRDTKLIKFKLEDVDRQREDVYKSSLRDVDGTDFHKHYAKWHDEIAEASRIAMRAQTNIDTLESRTEVFKKVQSDSANTAGVVGQLQLVVRGIGVLHADLEALQRSLDTGMRVTSATAATQAASAALLEEESTRMLHGYNDHGRPATVPNELP